MRPDGQHLYYAHGELARTLVDRGIAEIAHMNGRVRSIKLTATIEAQAVKLGPPQATLPLNTKFTKRVRTDSGCTWIEHHPRCLGPRSTMICFSP